MYHRDLLPNGLPVVCETIPYVRSVSIGFWVACGSRNESPCEEGISHLIEHMVFKGTKNRTTRQIAEAIDSVGGHLNAFTTKEYTCYYIKILDRHFRLGLELLADLVTNPLFTVEDLEKEKNVVLEEIKSYGDSPDELVFDLFTQTILDGHPLGHSILGTPETIDGIKQDTLISFKERFYTPGNSCLAVAGNIELPELLEAAESFWGLFSGVTQDVEDELPVKRGRTSFKRKDTEQVHLCLGVPGFHRRHQERYVLMVLDSILGGSTSSRLFQELREERGMVYTTGSQYSSFKDTGLFSIYAGTSPKHFPDVVTVIRQELKVLKEEPISAEEIRRAKEQIKGTLWLSLENTTNRMSRLAKSELFYQEMITPEEVIRRIDQVTAEDICRVANMLFQEDLLSLTAVGPFPQNYRLKGWN
ncbi:MAG TPA: insulinase family protein [Firmicutes bacterium]|nr:insulinase family protein [Bacillota bacterium]